MTYVFPDPEDRLRQGDIFFPLRSVYTDPASDLVESGDKSAWTRGTLQDSRQEVIVQLSARKTWAVLSTQDCDNLRTPSLSFHSIDPLKQAYPNSEKTTATKSWTNNITKHSRYNPHWFYLPADAHVGFSERMAVSFPEVFQVRRETVQAHRAILRKARLDGDALLHFRESLGRFYTRLAYDERYPMTPEERRSYDEEHSVDEPRPLKLEP